MLINYLNVDTPRLTPIGTELSEKRGANRNNLSPYAYERILQL